MSRIGRQPITVPADVKVEIERNLVRVTGPKGNLEQVIMPGLAVKQDGDQLIVSLSQATPESQRSFGLMRTLVANLVKGVSQGFERSLEINGVGYRASVAGEAVNLNLGFSHPVVYNLPTGISAKVEKNVITISGHDKQLVGQVAANIRALKKPEPYKGKGIKYSDEVIRRKAGKAATKG